MDILDLLDRMAPSVREAFLKSIRASLSDVVIRELEAAISARDFSHVVDLLEVDRSYFSTFDRALLETYVASGEAAMAALRAEARRQTGNVVRIAFDATNPAAVEWLRERSSALITSIGAHQRVVIRELLVARTEQAAGVRSIALDLVGRINRATGLREGGVIGLTQSQYHSAELAMQQLLSGDPAQMQAYLARSLRDRRFDPTVRAALRAGQPVPADKARDIVASYRNRLLRSRGETIARTEVLGALHESQQRGIGQLIDSGRIAPEDVTQMWDAANDADTRPSHAAMDGQVRPRGEPFLSGDGNQMLYPGDRSYGAPASDIINCRCYLRLDVDFLASLKR